MSMLVKKKRYMVLFANVNGRNCFLFLLISTRKKYPWQLIPKLKKSVYEHVKSFAFKCWYRPWHSDIDKFFYMYWYFIVRMNFCRCQYRLQNCFFSVKFDIIAGVTRYPAFCGYWQQLPRYRHRNQSRMRQSR